MSCTTGGSYVMTWSKRATRNWMWTTFVFVAVRGHPGSVPGFPRGYWLLFDACTIGGTPLNKGLLSEIQRSRKRLKGKTKCTPRRSRWQRHCFLPTRRLGAQSRTLVITGCIRPFPSLTRWKTHSLTRSFHVIPLMRFCLQPTQAHATQPQACCVGRV